MCKTGGRKDFHRGGRVQPELGEIKVKRDKHIELSEEKVGVGNT